METAGPDDTRVQSFALHSKQIEWTALANLLNGN